MPAFFLSMHVISITLQLDDIDLRLSPIDEYLGHMAAEYAGLIGSACRVGLLLTYSNIHVSVVGTLFALNVPKHAQACLHHVAFMSTSMSPPCLHTSPAHASL